MKKAEKDLEKSLLWEMMFELGSKGSIVNRQREKWNGLCLHKALRRKEGMEWKELASGA